MATSQQYSLRWNNYFRHLTYALDSHRSNDDFVDVSLCCDGRKIKAHKVVLSACSSYFKEIFKENPHPHPVIIFKFIKFEDLNSIIEFMYQGEVNVQQEALQSFLQTAELLAVQGLTAEEKEKPKAPRTPIDEQQLIKTIPSTIRAITESTVTQSSQTVEIPAATVVQQQHTQSLQHHQPQTQQQQQQHHQLPQLQQIHVQSQPQQTHQQLQLSASTGTGTATNNVVAAPSTMKKRKITFTDEDDNIYTTETVDYAVKNDPTIVKATEMTYLPATVKMDIPEYIVSDEDVQHITDASATSQQGSQDATAGQTVTQFTAEYEILTESEIEDKYQQAESGDNSEITIEMSRLLTTTAQSAESGKEDKGNSTTQAKMKLEAIERQQRELGHKYDKVLQVLRVIANNQKELTESLVASRQQANLDDNNKIFENFKFPLGTVQELQAFEKDLENTETKVKLTKALSSICGTSGTMQLNKVGLTFVNFLFKDELLQMYTWRGISGTAKLSFFNLIQVRKFISGVLRLADKTASELQVDAFIQNSALKHSGQRLRRQKGQKKSSTSSNIQNLESMRGEEEQRSRDEFDNIKRERTTTSTSLI